MAVLLAFRSALMLMLRCALRVSLLADQETALLTTISPLPLVSAAVAMLTLLLPRLVDRVVAPMPDAVRAPMPAAILKSTGSISQVPVLPPGAAVVTRASSAILTFAAEVSIKPPSPPFGAEASSTPPTITVPAAMSPSKVMVPLRFSRVRASMMPLLFTTARPRPWSPLAVSRTAPPAAPMAPRFAISALSAPSSTRIRIRPSAMKSTVAALAATSAAVPRDASIVPSFTTLGAIRATYPCGNARSVPALVMVPPAPSPRNR